MENELWVWIEHEQDEIQDSSLEMLGEARRLAKNLQAKVCAIFIGDEISGLSDQVIAYGADVIFLFDDKRMKNFNIDNYLKAFSSLLSGHTPRLIFIASTINGSNFAPRLAAHFKSGFSPNTITISVQPDQSLKINRSIYINKVHSVNQISSNSTVVVTMKPGSVGLDRADRSRKGEIVQCEVGELPTSHTEVQGFVKADPKVVSLDEAERVVAAGNGFKKKDDLALIWELSDMLGAAVGGSKPVFDKGWLPQKRMIGQSSGRRLASRLFLGAGVSGTSYFIEGMKESRLIIVINKDKGAPLMKLADLAVVGDLYEVLPELTKQLSARQKGLE